MSIFSVIYRMIASDVMCPGWVVTDKTGAEGLQALQSQAASSKTEAS